MKLKQLVVTLLASLTLLFGCQTIKDIVTDNENVSRGVIQYTTLKVIDGDTERAQRIIDVTSNIRSMMTGLDQVVTIDYLTTHLRSQIRWDRLDAADTVLVNTLIAEAERRINVEIRSGQLDDESAVVIARVLGWVDQAASAYTDGQSEDEILGGYRPTE